MNAASTDRTAAKTTLTISPAEVSQARELDPSELSSVVPQELAALLNRVVRIVAAGGTVTIGAIPEELTTTTTADLLGISRPTLMKLVNSGQIEAHKVGTHTRLNTDDVLAYRDRLQEEQRAALWKLRDFEESEGMDY